MATVSIEELIISLGDKKQIPLTMKQAKELYEALDSLFGEKAKIIIEREYYPRVIWRYSPDAHTYVWSGQSTNVSYSGSGFMKMKPLTELSVSSGLGWYSNESNNES